MDMMESDVKIKCFSIFHFYGSNKIIFDYLHKSKLIIRYENLKKIVCIYIYNFILFFFCLKKYRVHTQYECKPNKPIWFCPQLLWWTCHKFIGISISI